MLKLLNKKNILFKQKHRKKNIRKNILMLILIKII